MVFRAAKLVMQNAGNSRENPEESNSVGAQPQLSQLFVLLFLLFLGAADAVGDIGVAVVGILPRLCDR